jgi:hypothetical protein
MSTGAWVLMCTSLGYFGMVLVRYIKSRRRPVTLTDTLLATVLHNIGQH